MDVVGFGEEVDGIIYSAQAGFRKPQAEFFSYAERVLGRASHHLVLVDDTMANVEDACQGRWQASIGTEAKRCLRSWPQTWRKTLQAIQQ